MFKYLFILILVIFSIQATAQSKKPEDQPSKVKIGLVLGGGGAKGFAHIGVLKVLEEAGIPIDYVAGTSIGSLIGGLVAIGYDSKTMEQIVHRQSWDSVLADNVSRKYKPIYERNNNERYLLSMPIKSYSVNLPSGLTYGNNIVNFLAELTIGFHDKYDFTNYPIPFLCVATDLNSGEEKVFEYSDLPMAIRSSIAVPTAIVPAEVDNKLLVDGGLINNFPADNLKKKGCDYVIGVDIQSELLSKEQTTDLPSILEQLINLVGFDRTAQNRKHVDFQIKPNITGFSASNFSGEAADALIKRGEEAARKVLPELIKLRDSLNLKPNKIERYTPKIDTDSFYIQNVTIEGNKLLLNTQILGLLRFKIPGYITLNEIKEGMKYIYGSQYFKLANWRLLGDDKKTLAITLKEDSQNFFNVGAHYDSYENAALLANLTFKNLALNGSLFKIETKLSRNPMFAMRFIHDRGLKPGFVSEFHISNREFYIYDKGVKAGNYDLQYTKFNVGFQSSVQNELSYGAGIVVKDYIADYFTAQQNGTFRNYNTQFNYYFSVDFDSRDNALYPNSGWYLKGNTELITDNFYNYEGHNPFAIFDLHASRITQLSPSTALIAYINAHFATSKFDVPIYANSTVGGMFLNDYSGRQIPFVGYRYMELIARNVMTFRADLRFELFENNYFQLNGSAGVYSNANSGLNFSDGILGYGITYSYNSLVGPLEFSLMRSNTSDKLHTFVNLGYWF